MHTKYIALVLAMFAAQPSAVWAQDTLALDSSEFGDTIANSDLDENRGTFQPLIYNLSTLSASLDDNTCTNCTSGDNVISDGAFNNTNLVGTVLMNSGNNVIMQSNLTVNVEFNQTPELPWIGLKCTPCQVI